MKQRSILFVPDFIANAGGAIQATGYMEGKSEAEVLGHANSIFDTTLKVLQRSELQSITPLEAAYQIGQERLKGKAIT